MFIVLFGRVFLGTSKLFFWNTDDTDWTVFHRLTVSNIYFMLIQFLIKIDTLI